MKKVLLLLSSVLLLSLFASPAMALDASSPTLWFDVEVNGVPVPGEPDTVVYVNQGDDVSIDYYVSGMVTTSFNGFYGSFFETDFFKLVPRTGQVNPLFAVGNRFQNFENGYVEFEGGLPVGVEEPSGNDVWLMGMTLVVAAAEGSYTFPGEGASLDFIDSDENVIPLDLYTHTITFYVVPVPGTLMLLCSGLLGLIGIRRRS